MKWIGRGIERGRGTGCEFRFRGKDRYEVSGPLERGKDWGCGVVELVTHVHVTCTDSWSQGDREVHAGLLFLYLSSSLPSFLLVPGELPHLVKYMSST